MSSFLTCALWICWMNPSLDDLSASCCNSKQSLLWSQGIFLSLLTNPKCDFWARRLGLLLFPMCFLAVVCICATTYPPPPQALQQSLWTKVTQRWDFFFYLNASLFAVLLYSNSVLVLETAIMMFSVQWDIHALWKLDLPCCGEGQSSRAEQQKRFFILLQWWWSTVESLLLSTCLGRIVLLSPKFFHDYCSIQSC